jgi:hypothetical protein
MQIDVDMSFEQYFEACQLFCLKTTRWRRINYRAVMWAYPILGAVFALLAILTAIGNRGLSSAVSWQVAASVFFFASRFGYPARIRKLYNQQATNFAGTMTLTADGMRFERTNGTANTHYTWAAFDSWIDRPEMFMVLPGPTIFIRIPKDKLTSDEQEQVKGWLSSSKLLT